MSRPSPDHLCASLVLDYLSTAASITAGVPSAATLPKVLMDSGGTRSVPCLAVNGVESADSGGLQRSVNVVAMLFYLLKNTDSDAPADAASAARTISRETAAEYLDLIERRLRDRTSFNAWLATLDSDFLDGWTILKFHVQRQPAIEREKDQPVSAQTIALACQFTLAWAA